MYNEQSTILRNGNRYKYVHTGVGELNSMSEHKRYSKE